MLHKNVLPISSLPDSHSKNIPVKYIEIHKAYSKNKIHIFVL